MKKITFLFATILFAAGCHSNINVNETKERYLKSINFFDSALVDHFPDQLPDSCGYKTTVPHFDTLKMLGFGVDGIWLWKNYPASRFRSIISHFKGIAKNIYLSSDSDLLLIFPYSDEVKLEGKIYKDQEPLDRKKLALHNLRATTLPVPLFEIDEFKGNTICGLTDDFKLFVLDANPGNYINERYLQECECFPEIWKHGYSKGVAISNKRKAVIYWIVVW